MASLDEFIDGPFDEEAATTGDRFRVDTPAKAGWALRKLRVARQRQTRIDEQAREQRARIDEWHANETRRVERDVATFEAMLRAYHEQVLADDPTAKTLHLPDGELTIRPGRRSVDVIDVEVFLEWALDSAPELVRTKHEPDKTAIVAKTLTKELGDRIALVYDTGEMVPGVVIKVGPETFKATPVE